MSIAHLYTTAFIANQNLKTALRLSFYLNTIPPSKCLIMANSELINLTNKDLTTNRRVFLLISMPIR